MVDYVKMSLGETIMKTGGKKNGLKFVFNGWLYHKRCWNSRFCNNSICFHFFCIFVTYKILYTHTHIQGDSLARGPKLVYQQIFNEFVNQLTDDELTTGYYQQDGAACHTSNAGMREIESFFKDRIILKKKKPLATRISRSNICRLLSMGPIEGQSV